MIFNTSLFSGKYYPTMDMPSYTYTGNSNLTQSGNGWKLMLTTSGTLTFNYLPNSAIDIFLVGGGGGGATFAYQNTFEQDFRYRCGGGGGGGYTSTVANVAVTTGTAYTCTIGAGGAGGAISSGVYYVNGSNGSATSFKEGSTTIGTAAGGKGGKATTGSRAGGDGGSGGGAGGLYENIIAGKGGSDGGNGGATSDKSFAGGIGQGHTTREFGSSSGKLYAGGGGGGRGYNGLGGVTNS